MKRQGIYKPTVEDAVEIGGIETLHSDGFALAKRIAELAQYSMSSTRTRELKKAIQSADRELSTVRGRIFTDVFTRNIATPLVTKRALAYRKLMETIPVHIYDHELIVGGITEKRKGALLSPETSIEGMSMGLKINQPVKNMLNALTKALAGTAYRLNTFLGMQFSLARILMNMKFDNPATRSFQRFHVGKTERNDLTRHIIPYWKKHSAYTLYRKFLSREEKKFMKNYAYAAEHAFVGGVFLFHPNIEKTVMKGLNAVIQEAELLQSGENSAFYTAAADSCRAVIARANRYADLAEKLAKTEVSDRRRAELLKIAEICRQVPANPPRTFYEGLQSLWLIYTAVVNDDCGHEVPFGRWDQMLYPLYREDLENGRITRAEALELIECFILKSNEIEFFLHNGATLFEDGNTGRVTLTIGGVDQSGADATNEVSYLFLEALSNTRMIQPNPAVRLHRNTPEDFLNKVTEIMASGANTIQIFNDKTIIDGFVANGFDLTTSRNYIITGCVQQIPADTYGSVCAAHLVLPRTLELFLKSRESYESFEDFLVSYKNYLSSILEQTTRTLNNVDRAHGLLLPNTFVSAIAEGALQNGRDVKQGGVKHNITGISLLGLGTLADSLAAIKIAVFDQKKYTLQTLREMLRKNFEGFENDRLYLLNKIQKYGNDNDSVDSIACDIANFCADVVSRYTTYRKGKYSIGVHSENGHVVFGLVTGATPDGRKQTQPYSIGAGSARGNEKQGYTATLKSVSKLDMLKVISGVSINLRFSPSMFDSEGKLKRFTDVVRAYFFDYKGQNLQTTVVDASALREAQLHPEHYQDLLVRISGYSARFVDLTQQTQDEIISRTEYQG